MPRGLSVNQNTYVAGNSLIAVSLIKLQIYDGSYLYYTDCAFDLTVGGNTYLAEGDFISITAAEEKAVVEITNCTMVMTALDSDLVDKIARTEIINKTVTVERVYIDQTTLLVISGDPILMYEGFITSYSMRSDNKSGTLTLEISSQFDDFRKIKGRKTNLGNFQKEFPQDYSMEFSHVTLRDIKWGKK
jgi:hypothetical protein